MKIIVGLGNPGEEFYNTRHNLGFIFLDNIAKINNFVFKKEEFNGIYYEEKNFILLKPQNFINNSGICIRKFLKKFKINNKEEDILIIHDDLSLPFSKIKCKSFGSHGGHNGVKNIIKELGTNKIKRLKFGIGLNKEKKIKEWVLENFTKIEMEEIRRKITFCNSYLIKWVNETESFEKIMNYLNK